MRRASVILTVLLAAMLLSGCVERELTITSDPAGALVYLADDEIGRTPLTVPFTWYGDREVILRLRGYDTLSTHANITPPLYDIFPWDIISQAMVPWTYHYRTSRHYDLTPQVLPSDSALIKRAEQLHGALADQGK